MDGSTDIDDDLERATQIAEQAMARMVAEHVPPTPDHFTIWYAHYSGRAPDLSRAIEILTSNSQRFSEERLGELHDRFIGRRREGEALHAAGSGMQTMLARLIELLTQHGAEAGLYGQALQGAERGLGLAPDTDQLRRLLALILDETRRMKEQNRTLQSELSTSSEQLADLRRNLDDVRKQVITDALTGIFNRKHFDAELRRMATEAMEYGRPLALVMADIDHFKRFNDNYGHAVGDQVLTLVARTLADCIQDHDIAARYGGEEFAILMHGSAQEAAVQMAERIRARVAGKEVVNRARGRSLGAITLSAGVAVYRPGEPLATFVQRADEALYAAKRGGRNRVVAAEGQGEG